MNWNFFLRNFKMTHMLANDPRENVINKIKVIMISGGNPEICSNLCRVRFTSLMVAIVKISFIYYLIIIGLIFLMLTFFYIFVCAWFFIPTVIAIQISNFFSTFSICFQPTTTYYANFTIIIEYCHYLLEIFNKKF